MVQLEHWAWSMQTELIISHRLSNYEQCQVCMTLPFPSGHFLLLLADLVTSVLQ